MHKDAGGWRHGWPLLFHNEATGAEVPFHNSIIGTRKAEVLNSLIINTTAKANDTTDILQTFR